MPHIYFISHPEVILDKAVPITEWGLSEKGIARVEKMLETQAWLKDVGVVYSSNERKALIAAEMIAEHTGKELKRLEELGEMDRTSTGVLDFDEFNQVVDEFFARPTESIRGWETAVDAQDRIVQAVNKVVGDTEGVATIAIVSHGGVGALLRSHLQGTVISRDEDQPGQGHYFDFYTEHPELVSGWMPIDQ